MTSCLALSLALVYAMYRPDWDQIVNETRVHFVDRTLPGASIDPFTLEWLVANVKMAAVNYPWPLLLLAVPGIVLVHRRKEGTDRWYWMALLWSAYLFLTLLANKMERYIQPLYPCFCLLTAWSIVAYVPRRVQTALLAAVAAAFAGVLALTHVRPIPWFFSEPDTIAQQSAFHPFRYEFHMPGRERLARLRALGLDSECEVRPMLDQIRRWMSQDRGGRPVAVIYLRDPRRVRRMHPPVFFRRLIPGLTLALRDRIFVVPNVHEMDTVPMHLRHAPAVVILHGPEIAAGDIPAPLRPVARAELTVTCRGEAFPFGLTLARPTAEGPAPQPR